MKPIAKLSRPELITLINHLAEAHCAYAKGVAYDNTPVTEQDKEKYVNSMRRLIPEKRVKKP